MTARRLPHSRAMGSTSAGGGDHYRIDPDELARFNDGVNRSIDEYHLFPIVSYDGAPSQRPPAERPCQGCGARTRARHGICINCLKGSR